MTAEDTELLRRYVSDRSEADFAELVRRHIDMVYSAALRQLNGDIHLAEDLTQAVFADLARKACRLTSHSSLTGWLYTSTAYLAANLRRTECRRRRREGEAQKMNQLLDSPEPELDWNRLQPVLDDAMHALASRDREAVLLRYFKRLSLAEVGERLGLNENAARMRVERALEKLRRLLAKRGITSTSAVLSVLLTAHAVQAAPTGLAAALTATSVTAATTLTSNIGILKIMASIKLKAGIAALCVAVVVPIVVTQYVRSRQVATKAIASDYKQQEREHLRQAAQHMLALITFASTHGNQLPDSLEDAGLTGQQYELVFKGTVPDTNQAPSTIVIREKQAWRTPQGTWAKAYGFADAHSQVHVQPDSNFVAWENDPKRAW